MPSFLPASEYLALPRDPQKWVIKDLITSGGLTNLYGKPKAGKSFAALGMAHAIASGQPEWLGFPVFKHGTVAYLQIDTPRAEWASRLETMTAKGYDVSNIYICDMLMTKEYPVNMIDPEQFKWLRDELQALKPIVVFIDTIREAHSGDENDSTVMRNVVTNIVAAARPAAIVLLSHTRKAAEAAAREGTDDLMSDNRGSGYIAGRMDAVIKMNGNSQHATSMQYKGRGPGNGRIVVTQDEDTGLIMLDGGDAAYRTLMIETVTILRAQDASVSINRIAETIAEKTTHKKLRSITEDVKSYLRSIGVQIKGRAKK